MGRRDSAPGVAGAIIALLQPLLTPSLSIPPSPQGGPPLRRALESRQGLTSYAVTSIDDLDVPALTTLVDEAWRTDHSHQARLMWDEAFLRWFLTEPPWVGVLLCTPAGLLVGFELALERTLYGRQQEFRAYYASALAVSSSHRRRGLGRWLLEDLHHLVFVERRADLIYSSFLDGRAGGPTVEDTYARLPDWGVQRFHTSPIWGQRLDRIPPSSAPLGSSLRVARVVCDAGATVLTPIADEDMLPPPLIPSVKTLNETLRTRYEAAFGLGESFRAQYLSPRAARAGTFWYATDDDEAHCAISFQLTPIARPAPGLVGQIQTVHASRCPPLLLQEALRHLCRFFRDQECYAATILEQGVVPETVLYDLHFRPTRDQVIFAVRGPRATPAPFVAVSPPYCLDFS